MPPSLRPVACRCAHVDGVAFDGVAFDGVAFEGVAFEGVAEGRGL